MHMYRNRITKTCPCLTDRKRDERKERERVNERRVGETDCAVKGDGKGSM